MQLKSLTAHDVAWEMLPWCPVLADLQDHIEELIGPQQCICIPGFHLLPFDQVDQVVTVTTSCQHDKCEDLTHRQHAVFH